MKSGEGLGHAGGTPRKDVWDADRLLKAWGLWYEHGRLKTAGLTPSGDGVDGLDENHLAALYVEGLSPANVALAQAFVVAKPALVHLFARSRPHESFDVPLLPGQSEASRSIVCHLMEADYREALERRMLIERFSPSGFEAEW